MNKQSINEFNQHRFIAYNKVYWTMKDKENLNDIKLWYKINNEKSLLGFHNKNENFIKIDFLKN